MGILRKCEKRHIRDLNKLFNYSTLKYKITLLNESNQGKKVAKQKLFLVQTSTQEFKIYFNEKFLLEMEAQK